MEHNIWEVLPMAWHREFLEKTIEHLKQDIIAYCKIIGYNKEVNEHYMNIIDLERRFLKKCKKELQELGTQPSQKSFGGKNV